MKKWIENTFAQETPFALLLVLLTLISCVVYWDFLVFRQLYLYQDIGSDTLNYSYPHYVHLAEYIRSSGWPTWSFSQGMGQNIFPDMPGNPFDLLLVLLGADHFAYALVYMQVLKVLLAGIFFYLYLRALDLDPGTAVIGGLLFAFSGYMILAGTWYLSGYAMCFALLLYAFERFLRDRTWIYFPVGLALVTADRSFSLYPFAMFFLPYGIFRFYLVYGWQPRSLLLFLAKLFGLAVLGVGIAAVYLVPDLQQMVHSPRVLGEASLFDQLTERSPFGFEGFAHNITAVMRLFSNDLLGAGSDFRGWRNYLEAPIFYCGLLPLLLAPQVFLQLDRKQRVAFALFALVFLLPVVFPFFRYLFWAFSGDYYRLYSVFVALVFLYFGLAALNQVLTRGRVHRGLLIVTLLVLLCMLFSPYLLHGGIAGGRVKAEQLLMVTGLLMLYSVLVLFLGAERWKAAAHWGLMLVVCAELAAFSWQTVNDRSILTAAEYRAKAGYNDYTVEALATLRELDTGFYRIEKTYSSGPAMHRSINDAKAQGYFGTSSYHSFNQLNYIRFLDALDVIPGSNEAATRWARGIINHPLLTSFTGVKYLLFKRTDLLEHFRRHGYQFIRREGDVFVLLNPNYLPLGFTYDSYVTMDEFMSLPSQAKQVALMKAAVVDRPPALPGHEALDHLDLAGITNSYDSRAYLQDVEQRRLPNFELSVFDHKRLQGQIELDRPRMLFFSIPFDPGWKVRIDGQPQELSRVNIGFSGLILPAGKHTVELRYEVPYLRTSGFISAISVLALGLLTWWSRRRKEPSKERAPSV